MHSVNSVRESGDRNIALVRTIRIKYWYKSDVNISDFISVALPPFFC